MRICLVSDYLPGFHQTWSGAELLCWRLGQGLQQEGHNVSFITTRFKQKASPREQIYQLPTPLYNIYSLFTNLIADPLALLCSIMILRKLKPKIVHLHTKYLFLPILLSAKILKIPVIFTVLDYFIFCPILTLLKPSGEICASFHGAQCAECFYFSRLPLWLKKFLLYYRARLFRYSISKLDAIITLSQTSKARLEQAGLPANKIKVVYYYQIDSKAAELKTPVSSFTFPAILFAGQLAKAKGLHIILQAMPYVIKEIPQVRLMVAGTSNDEQYKAKIRQVVDSLGLKEHIEFLGKKENQDVLQLITRSNVIVVPEQWSSDFGPLILVEAKALGKPVVASRIGGIPEFIKDGVDGFCVAHDQPEEFAHKVTWLLQHEHEARRIGDNARNSTKFLFSNKPFKELTNIYYSVARVR